MKFLAQFPPKVRHDLSRQASVASLFVLLSLQLVFLTGCTEKKVQAIPDQAVPVMVAAVIQKDVPVELRAIGTVEAYSTVAVKSQVEGELAHVNFKEGQVVKRGELIFQIDSRPFQAELNQAEANLVKDEAQEKYAAAEASRYAELFASGVVSKQLTDQSRANAEALKATVAADQATVEKAKLELQYCTIHSPIDGRIGNLLVHEGNLVKANDTTLVTINQIYPIYVNFSVPEHYLAEIKKSVAEHQLPVLATVGSDDQHPEQGVLTFINNMVDSATGTILLKGQFANQNNALWPGQFVNVVLRLASRPNAVVVPTQAVQTGPSGLYVYVVQPDMTVGLRAVKTGSSAGGETVVEQGLRPGETVVTDGQLRLVPGSKIKVKSSLSGSADSRS